MEPYETFSFREFVTLKILKANTLICGRNPAAPSRDEHFTICGTDLSTCGRSPPSKLSLCSMKSLQSQKGCLSPLSFHSFHTFLEHLRARHSAGTSPMPDSLGRQTARLSENRHQVTWSGRKEGSLKLRSKVWEGMFQMEGTARQRLSGRRKQSGRGTWRMPVRQVMGS